MTRMTLYEPRRLDLLRRLTYRSSKFFYGRAVEPVQVIAHQKALMLGYGAVALSLDRFSKRVDKRHKELAMLRVSQLTGCEWCMDFGSRIAQDSGIDADTLRDLSLWRDSARFGEVDRLVLEYAEAMTRTPVAVTDELFTRLREHFDERQMVELTMAIGLENLYGRTNWAFGVESEGFSDGMYCVRRQAAQPVVADVAAR
jgi:AhpD family alkylhydroperoxidase